MENIVRTKHVEQMIENANRQLLANRVKRYQTSDLFWFVYDYLFPLHMYKGYNFCKIVEENGETKLVVADSTNYDVIQFI